MCRMKCGKRFYVETEQIVGQFKMLVAYTTPAKDINTSYFATTPFKLLQ